MARVQCTNTCYMPTGKKPRKGENQVVERYEDYFGNDADVYEIPDSRLEEFLDTGNFERVEDTD
ncbi:hypothetical protein LCGC14_2134810 [marine sediment metagenome]|uniref:Uncharacterized protein n=1 Tax=marine sediment metagenome TaxID=412755 RepID=A0A0F9GWH1_9ZZZZ